MANFIYNDAPTGGVAYPGTQSFESVPVQERLNTLTNILRAIHATLDTFEGVGVAQIAAEKGVNGIAPPAPMPGLCHLSEQAIQLAEHLDQRVRMVSGRIGRL